jgi:hypothetical protein
VPVRQGRRNVEDDSLAGLPVNLSTTENAVGARNLTKAAAARKGCRSRSSGTLKEGQSLRELSQEATPTLAAGMEDLTMVCRIIRPNQGGGSPNS